MTRPEVKYGGGVPSVKSSTARGTWRDAQAVARILHLRSQIISDHAASCQILPDYTGIFAKV